MRKIILFACLAVCMTVKGYTDHRNARVDSAEQVLNNSKHLSDKDRLNCYSILIRGYLGKDGEKHDRYCREMLALTYKTDSKNMRESALYNLGLQNYGQEKYEEAERYFLWALAVTDSMKNDKRYSESDIDDNLSQLYGAIGNVYNMQDKALLAIEYYQKALPIFEKHGWLESQTILHHNVAELWLSMGNNEKAEAEYLKAVRTGEASGDSLMAALPRKGLVKIYINEGDYDKARQTILPAYDYYHAHRKEETGDYPEILASMTKLYLMDGHTDLAKAKAYAEEGLSLVNDEMMMETRSDIYAAATMVAMEEHRWQQALDYALKSIHENDDDATYGDIGCYELLAQIYMQLGNKEQASIYIKKVRTLQERLSTRNYQSGLSQMEVLYETAQKEAQIATLDKERGLYRWLLGLAVALLVTMVIGYCLLVIVHRRKRALLAAKVALEAETKERQILARDLHDGLGGMLSLLRMKSLTPSSPGLSQSEGSEYIQLLDRIIVELRRTAHHLMPEELLRNGLISALNDFAVSVPGAKFQAIGDISMEKNKELVLYRCTYELVNNALKHAEASHIDIQLMQDEKEITLTVSDDGKGISHTSHHLPLTSNNMGLQNIRERIEPYHGTLNIITAEGKGTDIHIILPL